MNHEKLISDISYAINKFREFSSENEDIYIDIYERVNDELKNDLLIKIDHITQFIGNTTNILLSENEYIKDELINLVSYIKDSNDIYNVNEEMFRDELKLVHAISKHITTITTPKEEFPKPAINVVDDNPIDLPDIQSNWYYNDYQQDYSEYNGVNSLRVTAKVVQKSYSSLFAGAIIKNEYDLRYLMSIVPTYDLALRDFGPTIEKANILHDKILQLRENYDKVKLSRNNIIIYSVYADLIMYVFKNNLDMTLLFLKPDETKPEAKEVNIDIECFIDKSNNYNELKIKLIGNYKYNDLNKDSEDLSVYKWFICDTIDGEYTEIENEDSLEYILQGEYREKFYIFEVTPKSKTGTDETLIGDPTRSFPIYIP